MMGVNNNGRILWGRERGGGFVNMGDEGKGGGFRKRGGFKSWLNKFECKLNVFQKYLISLIYKG